MTEPTVRTFAETSALYSLMQDDPADTRRIITEMTPGERAEYAGLIDRLRKLIGTDCDACGHPTPVADGVSIGLFGVRTWLCKPCHARQPQAA